MRTTALIGAVLLVLASQADAQQAPAASAAAPQVVSTPAPVVAPFAPKFGQVDVGFRGGGVDGDAARYNRFRDLRRGGYVDRFKLNRETETWAFQARASNVGYRDQRYSADFESIGRLKLGVEWNQVPLFLSDVTRTLYKDNGNGVLSIDDAVQLDVQNGAAINPAARDLALRTALAGATRFDMRSRRDVGTVAMAYTVNRDVDVTFNLRTTSRAGHNLMSFGFGTSPGLSPAVEMGVPTDDRTTDVKGGVEYANARGLVSIGYNASWFDNHRPTVQFDNPLRAVDIIAGPSSGLAVLWPTNRSISYTVNGSYKLPARSRASAFLSMGRWSQDEDLVNPTVNTALTLLAPPLERASAEARADIVSMVYNLNSRPSEYLWLNARYRYYDYANKTPLYESLALVGDWAPGTALWENEPSSVKRQTLELDASVSPYRYLGLSAGFTREDGDRTFRIFEKTAEDTFRVSVDSTGNQFVTLRTKFEHSNRVGSGFEPALLEEVGEQPDMRHYDIADRKRDRVTAMINVTPTGFLDVNASISAGKDNYGQTGFGLRSNNNRAWSVGADLIPAPAINLGVNFGSERYTALQYSRTANPLSATDLTFNDPTRNWSLDQADTVRTFSASADFLKFLPKTDARFGLDVSDGRATYVYGLTAEQRIFTTVALAPLSPLKNRLTDGRFDLQYHVRPNLVLGGAYGYEQYKVEDFALGEATLNRLDPVNAAGVFASTIYSGYLYRDYTAHTGWLRLTYLW
ncbi:MAG: MtrB/PioB family outer membrane beta-barrel protein [Vicinamibacterales bacterium]